jgi:hypothetical protein
MCAITALQFGVFWHMVRHASLLVAVAPDPGRFLPGMSVLERYVPHCATALQKKMFWTQYRSF